MHPFTSAIVVFAIIGALNHAAADSTLSQWATAGPVEIHIAYAGQDSEGNSNAMAVSWMTSNATSSPTVLYGLDPNGLTSTATGTTRTYLNGFHHHTVLPSLKPATRYYYRCGDSTNGFSSVLSFITAPLSSEESSSASFIVVGEALFHA